MVTLHAAWYSYYWAFDGPVAALPPGVYEDAARGPELADDELEESDENQQGQSQKIRTEFPETWLWSDYVSE